MSSASNTTMNSGPLAGVASLRTKWFWIAGLGALYVICGVVALGSVVMATVASVFAVGAMMIVAGVGEIIGALQMKSWGKSLVWIVLGALYVVAGFSAFENPLLTAALLTLLLGAALVASGFLRIFLAFSMKAHSAWVWVLASGVITVLLGAAILAQWPVSSLYILGTFLGIDLIFAGASWLSIGMALRPRS